MTEEPGESTTPQENPEGKARRLFTIKRRVVEPCKVEQLAASEADVSSKSSLEGQIAVAK